MGVPNAVEGWRATSLSGWAWATIVLDVATRLTVVGGCAVTVLSLWEPDLRYDHYGAHAIFGFLAVLMAAWQLAAIALVLWRWESEDPGRARSVVVILLLASVRPIWLATAAMVATPLGAVLVVMGTVATYVVGGVALLGARD